MIAQVRENSPVPRPYVLVHQLTSASSCRPFTGLDRMERVLFEIWLECSNPTESSL